MLELAAFTVNECFTQNDDGKMSRQLELILIGCEPEYAVDEEGALSSHRATRTLRIVAGEKSLRELTMVLIKVLTEKDKQKTESNVESPEVPPAAGESAIEKVTQ